MVHVYIGLGSNLGDKERNLRLAYGHISTTQEIQTVGLSRFYETVPAGGPPQPLFLNAVLDMKTALPPHQLLERFQHIETLMGRIRTAKWGPRTIDIDILLYGDAIVDDEQLKIPHPLMHTRLFVLEPFVEIAPNVVHPVLKKPIVQLYKELRTSLAIPV